MAIIDKALKLFGAVLMFLVVIEFITGGLISTSYRNAVDPTGKRYQHSEAIQGSSDRQSTRIRISFKDITSEPPLVQAMIVTALVAAVISSVAHFYIVILALVSNVPWGIVCFMLPPASFLYALLNFEKCRLPLIGLIVGLIFAGFSWILFILS